MTRNDRAPKDLELTAAEYVLGTIEGDERLGFERRLAQDPAARRAVETWEQRLAGLDALEGESAPPDGLWSRIEALIDDGGPDTLTIRAEEGEWHEIYPGIQRKTLYRNAADGTQSYLLRIAPGAEIPAHPHDKLEECYFLEGEVIMGTERFHAGDYHAAPPGSDHQVITSRNGALLLIRGGVKAA